MSSPDNANNINKPAEGPKRHHSPKGRGLIKGLFLAAALNMAAAGLAPREAMAQEPATADQRARLEQLIKSGEITQGELEQFLKENQPAGEAAKTRKLTKEAQKEFLSVLEARFNNTPKHYKRYEGKGGKFTIEKVSFPEIKKALEKNPALVFALARMEETGGAPDLIDATETEFIFGDCSGESPEGRRDLTYDEAARMAEKMGVEMMDEAVYRKFQETGKIDSDSYSWLLTDAATRQAGVALYGTRDGGDVRVDERYAEGRRSNGGWRGVLRVPKS